MQKESFIFKKSWLLAIEGYASNVRCEFYEAIFAYLSCGRTVDLVSGGAKRAFASVKRDIDLGNADVDAADISKSKVDKQQHISDVRREAQKKGVENRRARKNEFTKFTNDDFVNFVNDTPQPHIDKLDNNIINNKNINQKIEKESRKKEIEKVTARPSIGMERESHQMDEENDIDVKAFVEYFNETLRKAGAVIPHMTTCCGRRAQSLKARCRENGKLAVKTMVDKAAVSDFLNGKNNLGWTATIDWLLRPNNFVKVIEGNYDNCKQRLIISEYGNNKSTTYIDPRRGTPARQHTLEEFLAQD